MVHMQAHPSHTYRDVFCCGGWRRRRPYANLSSRNLVLYRGLGSSMWTCRASAGMRGSHCSRGLLPMVNLPSRRLSSRCRGYMIPPLGPSPLQNSGDYRFQMPFELYISHLLVFFLNHHHRLSNLEHHLDIPPAQGHIFRYNSVVDFQIPFHATGPIPRTPVPHQKDNNHSYTQDRVWHPQHTVRHY